MKSVVDIFAMLSGVWHFNRTLVDVGTVSGIACFEEIHPHSLHYKETGVFVTQTQQRHRIYREYSYDYNPQTDIISVNFVEGGKPTYLFHDLMFELPDRTSAKGWHRCNQDMYFAKYIFTSADKFCIYYQVEGPTKNYRSETVFLRATFEV